MRAALALRTLRQSVRRPAVELRHLQREKLTRLVRHAYAAVPYYRRRFDQAGLSPEDIRDLDDLSRIPITRPEVYREVPPKERLAAGSSPERLVARWSSGSAGIPVSLYFTPDELAYHGLLSLRSEIELGTRLRDHLVLIDPPELRHRRRWFERFGVLRKSSLDMWDDLATQVLQLRRLRADVLIGYAGHVRLLAHWARSHDVSDLRFRHVFTHSGPLPPEGRELIACTFQASVFNRYDSWETGVIAWECERQGCHIDADHVLVECLAEGKPTPGAGEVVVTNLDLYAMPILRYALDDIASLETAPCGCGRTLPRLRALHGRTTDVIRLPDGRLLDMILLQQLFKTMENVVQYRIVQESAVDYRLEILPGVGFMERTATDAVERFRRFCGEGTRVRTVLLDQATAPSPTKWRYLSSEVPVATLE